jgi:hypothetical protein
LLHAVHSVIGARFGLTGAKFLSLVEIFEWLHRQFMAVVANILRACTVAQDMLANQMVGRALRFDVA